MVEIQAELAGQLVKWYWLLCNSRLLCVGFGLSLVGNLLWFRSSMEDATVGVQDSSQHPNSHVGWTWQLGRVELISDAKAFRTAFERFVHNDESGFSEDKLKHRGEECRVSEVHFDHTILCTFDDQDSFILPFEVVRRQVSVMKLHLAVNPVRFGRVQLLETEQAFRQAFARFEGDPLNGFTGAKLAHRGQTCGVMKLTPERSLTCLFDRGEYLDFPWEAVAKQVEVSDFTVDPVRHGHVRLFRDLTIFEKAFHRLRGDKKLRFSQDKLARHGEECHVTHVYVTRTFRCRFQDGGDIKLPWEVVERSIDSDGESHHQEDDQEVRDEEHQDHTLQDWAVGKEDGEKEPGHEDEKDDTQHGQPGNADYTDHRQHEEEVQEQEHTEEKSDEEDNPDGHVDEPEEDEEHDQRHEGTDADSEHDHHDPDHDHSDESQHHEDADGDLDGDHEKEDSHHDKGQDPHDEPGREDEHHEDTQDADHNHHEEEHHEDHTLHEDEHHEKAPEEPTNPIEDAPYEDAHVVHDDLHV